MGEFRTVINFNNVSWPRALLIALAFIAGYLAVDQISHIYPMKRFNFTPWNPEPALAIALLMIGGPRWIPAVFIATVLTLALTAAPTVSISAYFLIAGILTFGNFAAAYALTSNKYGVSLKLDSQRDLLRLTMVVSIVSLIVGIASAAILIADGTGKSSRYLPAVLRFWIGNGVGILVTLPLILMMLNRERRAQMRAMLYRKETIAQIIAIGLVLWVVFNYSQLGDFKLFYLLFLPLIWIATRSGMIGTAFATALIQAGIVLEVQADEYRTLSVFEVQALLMALTITGFFLGVTVEEYKRATKELRRSLKLAAAGEMAAALAHELNQPLTALSSYAKASQILVDAPNGNNEQLRDALRKLNSEATRAADVVKRLRDFFSTGSTQLKNVSLPTLVENVIRSMGTRVQSSGTHIELSVASPIPNVLIDPLQIEVVIRNLISNAIDAVADNDNDKRSVHVQIEVQKHAVVQLTVTDAGAGISAEHMENLFEPFSSTKATGMGMGLAISRAIVEGHGGKLWAKPGTQGVLIFTLPLKETINV